jgi:hypothetical protein
VTEAPSEDPKAEADVQPGTVLNSVDGTQDSPTTPSLGARSVEITVARIAAYAAVGGALLAVGATVVGALIGGYYTSATTDKQILAESQRATTGFLRDQQKIVYSACLVDDSNLSKLEGQFNSLVFHPDPRDAPTPNPTGLPSDTLGAFVSPKNLRLLGKLQQQIPDAFDKLQTDVSGIDLIGSIPARDAADALLNEHFQLVIQVVGDEPLTSRTEDSLSQFRDERGPLGIPAPGYKTPSQEFLDAARSDLGNR